MTGAQRDRPERLTPADASNVAIDSPDQVNAFLLAGILAPGGVVAQDGAVDLVTLRSQLVLRLPTVPRLSQRIAVQRGALIWQPTDVDLAHHVRLVTPVDGLRGLEDLCASLIVTPLAPDRPLWELLLVPGVARDRLGIVVRIHHAVADGVAAVQLIQALMDAVPGQSRPTVSAQGPMPSPQARRPRRLAALRSGITRTAAMLVRRIPATILIGHLGPERTISFVEVDLGALAAGAGTDDATVNDGLLTAVAAGVESALAARGERVPETLPVSVPVALPDRGGSGNAVGVMLVDLPLVVSDAQQRLRRVSESTRAAKADARSRGSMELTRTRIGARLFARIARHQRLVAGFVTNVRGPSSVLALGGSPLERVWPVTALQGNVRLGVSAISYAGTLGCAIHCEAGGLDARVVGPAIEAELGRIAARANVRNQ